MLASASADKSIRLWDASTGTELRRLTGHRDMVWSVVFSPDGKTLASGSQDGTILFWEPSSGKQLRQIVTQHQLIRSVAFSPRGEILASGGADNRVCLWEVTSGKKLRQLEGHKERVTFVVFSPDGKYLASGSWDTTICLWDPATGHLLRRLNDNRKVIVSLAFSPDSKLLTAGTFAGNPLLIWETATGKEYRRLTVPKDCLSFAAFAPNGESVAGVTVGSPGNALHLWDVATGTERSRLAMLQTEPQCLAYPPYGKLLAAGGKDGSILLWEVATGKRKWGVRARDGPNGLASVFIGHEQGVQSLAVSPDGTTLASGGDDATIRLWNPTTGLERRRYVGHNGSVICLAWSPDGQLLASGGADKTVRLWEGATGKELRHLQQVPEVVIRLTFSADGKTLFTQSQGGRVGLWDLTTLQELSSFEGEKEQTSSSVLSPDGRTLALVHVDGSLSLLDVLSKANRRKLLGPSTQGVKRRFRRQVNGTTALAFSPDGRLLAMLGREDNSQVLRIWETATRKTFCRFSDWRGDAATLAFSPTGKSIAVGGSERIGPIWNLTNGREIDLLLGTGRDIYALVFSPDGNTLFAGSSDPAIFVWERPALESSFAVSDLSASELENLWTALGNDEPQPAYQAIWKLAARSRQALPFLLQRLHAPAGPDVSRIGQLIADLDSSSFPVRKKATAELTKLGHAAEPALRRALKSKPSLEVSRRVEALLARLEEHIPPPEQLRYLRAVAVLEQIGTDEARQLLGKLARAGTNDALAESAHLALDRLAGRPSTTP
jgi:WD40 repeat protein